MQLSYWNPRLLRTVLCQLQQQQQTGLFCDVTLQGDGGGIPVHSCVIAACSPYLANLLMCLSQVSDVSDSKTPKLSKRHELRLHGIKSIYLIPLVHYMYTSELKVTPGDASGVLAAAQKLQIPELELLKLERGKLVRIKCERKLNRNCLGSKTYSRCVKAEEQVKAENQVIVNPEISPTRNCQSKTEDCVSLLDTEQSSENTFDIETSSCSLPEIEPGNLNCLENVLSSDGSLEDLGSGNGCLVDVPSSDDLLQYLLSNQSSQDDVPPNHISIEEIANSQDLMENSQRTEVLLENGSVGQDAQENLLKKCRSSSCPQNKNNNGVMPTQERECVGVPQHSGYQTQKRKGMLNRIRLDRKNEEIAPVDPEFLKLKSPDINGNNIINFSDSKFEKSDNLYFRNSSLPNSGLDEVLFTSRELTDPPVTDVNISNSVPNTSLESFKEALPVLKKEVHNGTVDCTSLKLNTQDECTNSGTVDQDGLTSRTCYEPEKRVEHAHSKITQGSKKRCYILDDCSNKAEKVKLRKASDGISWEVVDEVVTSNIPCPSNTNEHLKELEEQVPVNSDVDVGGYSPPMFLECVWPDLSSDSDIEVDILG